MEISEFGRVKVDILVNGCLNEPKEMERDLKDLACKEGNIRRRGWRAAELGTVNV